MALYLKKAQGITEYAILLALAVSVIVGMQVYVRRGLQGRLRESSDFLAATMDQGAGPSCNNQYEPYYRDIDKEISQESSLRQRLFEAGRQRKEYLQDTTRINQTEVTK